MEEYKVKSGVKKMFNHSGTNVKDHHSNAVAFNSLGRPHQSGAEKLNRNQRRKGMPTSTQTIKKHLSDLTYYQLLDINYKTATYNQIYPAGSCHWILSRRKTFVLAPIKRYLKVIL